MLGGTTGQEIPYPALELYDVQSGAPNYRNVATCAVLGGRSINIADVYKTREFDFSEMRDFDRQNAYRTVSCLTVPLKNYENAVIGVLQLINAQDPRANTIVHFESYQQLVVESLASQAAVALSNYVLLQRQKELLQLEQDMHIGRQIQAGFLPVEMPKLSGWEIAAYFQPARVVSGDFYDVFRLPNDKVGLVIGDVADKGVPAALFMALVRSLIRAFAQEHLLEHWTQYLEKPVPVTSTNGRGGYTLRNTVTLTNNYIMHNHAHMHMFTTLFFGVLDPISGRLEYVNCGHCPPILVNGSGVKSRLLPTNPVVGAMPDLKLEISMVELGYGDTLLMFTDGVTDSRKAGGEFYGEERLLKFVTNRAYHSANGMLDAIRQSIQEYCGEAEQFDDITILALRRA
jgi:sigma-B regulation protein RsbU (phosphoserine phosphatase)